MGIAVAAQQALGFEALGIETNPKAKELAHKLFGAEIRDLNVDEMPANLALFTMFEVLEHIKYPRDFLNVALRHMAEGAAIVGSVPNYNGIGRYVHGKDSTALGWPEHVNQFTRRSLAKTLAEAGFEVVYIGFPAPYGVVLTLNFRSWLRQALPSGQTADHIVSWVTWIKKYVVYPLPNLFAEITGLLGHGLVFVASKPKSLTGQ